MQRLDEFRLFYNHTIHPELMRLEKKRKALLLLFAFSIILFLSVIGLNFYLEAFALVLLLLIPLGLYASFLLYKMRKFVTTFKPQVVNLILDFIDDGPNFGELKYDSKKMINKKTFLKSQLFATKPKEYQGEDFITGKIGELDFELCELNVKEMSRVRTQLNEVFRGVFLHATFNTLSTGTVIIWPKESKQYLTRAIKGFTKRGGYEINDVMEVESFRELFIAYADDEANILKTLNRDMQIALADYRIKTDKAIYVSFFADNIFVGISEPKDILEPFIFRSNIDFELVREFYEDLEMIFNVVETFDQNN